MLVPSGAGIMGHGSQDQADRSKAPAMSRDEWELAFMRKVDELRPDMGRKYLARLSRRPKHQAKALA